MEKKSTKCKINNYGIIWSYIADNVFYETENNWQIKENGIGNISEGWERMIAYNLLKQWPQNQHFSHM